MSSGSGYASQAVAGAEETAEQLAPTDLAEVDGELYGEAKVACEQASAAYLLFRGLFSRAGRC